MKKFPALLAILLLSLPCLTDADQPDKVKPDPAVGRAAPQGPAAQLRKHLANAELTGEQAEKLKKLSAKAEERLRELNKEAGINRQVRQKMQQARKEGQQAGKKQKELKDHVAEAAGLSEKQIAALESIDRYTLEFLLAAHAVLTEEQRQLLPQPMRKRLENAARQQQRQKRQATKEKT